LYERKATLYWVRQPKEKKDLQVFDVGYFEGKVYIYEYKTSYSLKEIEEEINAYYKGEKVSQELIKENVRLWIEKRFGYPMSWKVKLE